jgi:pimeloyl-ACP methyl ester carboxylesterase
MLLAFDDYGPGPVVVLLHGFPLNRSMWWGQETGVGSTYRLIVPDLRGHGETAAPEGVYTVDEMAGDVVELLDALQLTEPIVLGGLSMGGYVALALMARWPERVRGLMLMDTRVTADTPEAARNREALARQVEQSGDVTPVVDSMLPKLLASAAREGHPERVASVLEMMQKTPARAVAGALRGLAARPDRSALLAQIRVPTLVLVGADDVITPPAESQAMAQAIPGARLVVIPDAGHLAPMENPAAVNAAMLEFLGSLP